MSTMNRFDKLSLLFPNSCVDMGSLDMTRFKEVRKQDRILYFKYEQKQPYLLSIRIDLSKGTSIEFTGKILKDDYPKLINGKTITQCLEEINRLEICLLDIPSVLREAQVMKCDVTLDIERNEDFTRTLASLKASIKNRDKWIHKKYPNGMAIENTVSCNRYKKRLVVYQKDEELELAENKAFLNSLNNPQAVLDYFKGKMRIEINLKSKNQIRKMLQIQDTNLHSVLTSQANPILAIIDETLKSVDMSNPQHSTLRDLERTALLEDCDWNLDTVEAKIRSLQSKNTRVSRAMEQYRRLSIQHERFKDLHTDNLRDLVVRASSLDSSTKPFKNKDPHPIMNIENHPCLLF